jgi:hypothetical protein
MRFRSIAVLLLGLAVASGVLYARWTRRSRFPAAEPEAPAVLPSPPAESPAASPSAGPVASDIQPTLDRLFDGSLVVDRDVRPSFVTGDFTGDSVTDLAVAVRPRGDDALPRLNVDVPRWRLQDAAEAGDARREARPIRAGERLLAVVHGVAGGSWPAPDDRPSYLVRNAVGSGMRTRPLNAVPPAIRMQVPRTHTGDVIEEERGTSRGLILWTGAAYTWADLAGGG